MFTEQEMSIFYGVSQHTEELVEMDCGCTSPRYGDTPGKLRLYVNGKIEIDCICGINCLRVNLSPIDFAKHAGRTNASTHWKSQVWVFNNEGLKLALRKTCLLKHHAEAFQRPMRQVVHRDEFKICSLCYKERRFNLRNKEACRIYHDALLDDDWKCSDMANQELSCLEAEERECRKVVKGCPRASRCTGCERCVCFGCDMCRFEDCSCRTCVEFILNMEN